MGLPGTKTTRKNGQLGKTAPSEDGISCLIVNGVAVGGQFALGDVLGPFLSPADAIAKGIDEAYDTTNSTIAYKHIADFYLTAPTGTKLYVMVVAMTQNLTLSCTAGTANGVKKVVETIGNLCLLGITYTPNGAYTPTYSGQFEADLWTALTQLKITHADQETRKRPFDVLIEGRNFQGSAATSTDMRTPAASPNANMALVVVGNDWDYGQGAGIKSKYASVGYMLGCAAAVKVNRNIGRVLSGSIAFSNPGFSNGAVLNSLDDANQDLLHDHGFVFFRKHANKAGFYISDDPMACVSTDDYSQLTLSRTMKKAIKICHEVNADQILDEIFVDPDTGLLPVEVCKQYQGLLDTDLNDKMVSKQECVSAVTTIDPNQPITTTRKIKEVLKIVPSTSVAEIETTLEYTTALAKP